MDKAVMDLLMSKRDSRRDRRRDSRRDRRDYADYADYEDREDRRDYEEDYEDDYEDYEDSRDYEDNRRGVKGSGRRDRRDSEDGRRGVRGSGRRDRRDYDHSKLRLTKSDMHEWKQMMENADGTRGVHYDKQQISAVADKLHVRFDEFTEAEFCLAVNMMYSDYCRTAKKYVSPDKTLDFCVDLALDFFDDPDAPEPWTKLLMYYHCIVNA